ncbi:hypothetical protein N7513_003311 [Penicillium frequentans]|uniref:DDE-1 domain-containing protein n=1 Tax=Penicillium frequentans TaxID=3151616 RepID=A0AAD6GHB4_9EURO|nr:hypothetical protein N7494_005316 [Penicillium glabrum]KAJ5557725.1 hypothetical protein N7513_003311 [Penicillium glabrum]
MYSYRLLKRLPKHINVITRKPKEALRIQAEDTGRPTHWHEFEAHEIYNWDETSFQIGQGLNQNVHSTHQTANMTTGDQGENVTGIECISADGWVIFPWILIKGSVRLEDWYDLSDSYRIIHLTPNGWTDNETAYRWLCSFHEPTKTRVKRGRPRLLLWIIIRLIQQSDSSIFVRSI